MGSTNYDNIVFIVIFCLFEPKEEEKDFFLLSKRVRRVEVGRMRYCSVIVIMYYIESSQNGLA